jgi:hypothetical protein
MFFYCLGSLKVWDLPRGYEEWSSWVIIQVSDHPSREGFSFAWQLLGVASLLSSVQMITIAKLIEPLLCARNGLKCY